MTSSLILPSHFPVDSHCHLRFPTSNQPKQQFESCCKNNDPLPETKPIVIRPADQFVQQQLQLEQTCLFCSTSPGTDWDDIEKLLILVSNFKKGNSASTSYFGFGIHPWWVPSSSSSWQDRLCQLLTKFPSAIVGEIGLDKLIAEKNEKKSGSNDDEKEQDSIFKKQIDIFEGQMDIAALMKRPVSVHCVRAQGPMLELLSNRPVEKYPPSFVFHGFTGSTEFAKSVLKLNKGRGSKFYFGFCSATTGTLKHFSELMKVIPQSRILIESDVFANEEEDGRMGQERLRSMTERLLKESEGKITPDVLKENFFNAMSI